MAPVDYADQLVAHFQANANPAKAAPMAKYMRNQFAFFGIMSAPRKALTRAFFKTHGVPDYPDLQIIVPLLWQQPQRECQYFAMELIHQNAKTHPREAIEIYEAMTTNKSWWDTIDFIAASLVGTHFSVYPDMRHGKADAWQKNDNMWLHRIAILCQLKYKAKTDTDLLQKIILTDAQWRTFFIEKAIGWALREYSKTNAKWVQTFVKDAPISASSKKEALKWLSRQSTTLSTEA
jgi:3-methyladenine DNA glycosylase AlkD